jgi:hypothetical protein
MCSAPQIAWLNPAAANSRRNQLVILGPNSPDETIELGLLADDAHEMRDLAIMPRV